MRNNTWKKAIKSASTAMLGLGVTGLVMTPNVKADNYPTQDGTAFSSVNNNIVARNSVNQPQEFLSVKLYPHQHKKQNAVTLHFQNIPLLTFLESPNQSAMAQARTLAVKLDRLFNESADGNDITVSWNPTTKDYSVKFQEEELVRLNNTVILPDATRNKTHDALQATNRLRRLMGNASPLTEVQGKTVLEADNRMDTLGGVKSLRKAAQGIASWYGPGFHGRRTASGERFNQHDLTAAHRTLPFGTRVLVTNMRNGRSVVVRINDRGPHIRGRIIDLSAGAARAIGVKSNGVAPITMQILN